MPNSFSPCSCARLTTSKLVEVPMVVAMPPTKVAKPIGMRTFEGDLLVRRHTEISMGNSNTTIGVLLTNADSTPPTMRVSSSEKTGALPHRPDSIRPTGSSAPVRTKPWPNTIRAHTLISASWAKPAKKSVAFTSSNGATAKPRTMIPSKHRAVISSFSSSLLNSTRATTVKAIMAIAWGLGNWGISIMWRPICARW